MKLFFLLLLFNSFHSILSKSFKSPFFEFDKAKYGEEIGILSLNLVTNIMNETYINVKDKLNKTCSDLFKQSLDEPNKLYMIKLIKDSSKNKNDLESYFDCFTINYPSYNISSSTNLIKQNLTYLVIHVQRSTNWYNVSDLRYELGNFIVGACVIKGCSLDDFSLIFDSFNNETGIFPNTTIDDVKFFDWGEYYTTDSRVTYIWDLIPIYVVLFIFLCSIFPTIPVNILKFLFKTKVNSTDHHQVDTFEIRNKFMDDDDAENNHKQSNKKNEFQSQRESQYSARHTKSKYDKSKLNKLKNCFILNENADEIFNTNVSIHNVNINDDSGLAIVKGLRGFNLIFTIIGCVFKILFDSPIKVYSNVTFKPLVTSGFFCSVLFGLRFSPRLSFAISGYCLIYKFLFYLDSEVDKWESKNNKEEVVNSISTSDHLIKNSKFTFENNKTYTLVDGGEEKERDNLCLENEEFNIKKLTNSNVRERLSKYSFTKQTTPLDNKELNTCVIGSTPFGNKIQNSLKMKTLSTKLNSYEVHSKYSLTLPYSSLFYFISLQFYQYFLFVLATLTFKYSFYSLVDAIYSPGPLWLYLKQKIINTFNNSQVISVIFLFSAFSAEISYIHDTFWWATNEIFFFLFFTTLIFIFYKKNWRLDLLIIISFFMLILGKIGLFFIIFYSNCANFLPALIFQTNSMNFISNNPFYNMPCFLVGLFFGSVNYCIQKSITDDNFSDVNKKFLKIPHCFTSFYKNHQSIKVLISSIISFLLLTCILTGFLVIYNIYFCEDEFMNQFFENIMVNIFFLIDIDLGVLLIFFIIMPISLMGNSFIINFFKHEYWNFISRPYFTYLLTMFMITFFVFYQSESRIKLNMFNIVFFSFLIIMIMMILCAIFYIFLEVPLKKLNKFLVAEFRERKNKLHEQDIGLDDTSGQTTNNERNINSEK